MSFPSLFFLAVLTLTVALNSSVGNCVPLPHWSSLFHPETQSVST